MTERTTDEHLPGLSKREVLETMKPDALVDHIIAQGERVSSIEREMSLAADILEGYGTSIEKELQERNTQDET